MAAGDGRTRWQVFRFRYAVQAICLLLAVYLAAAMRFDWWSPLPADLFLRLSPLAWLVSSVASRAWASHGWLVLALLVVTALLGRVFCGWLCPLGTVLNALDPYVPRILPRGVAARFAEFRFWVLAFLLVVAMVGVNLSGWLDPLVILSRAVHADPRAGAIAAAVAWGTVALILVLVSCGTRFWCRAICPLGAILSWVSLRAPFRRRLVGTCKACGKCTEICPSEQSWGRHAVGECFVCGRCVTACSSGALSLSFPVAAPSGERSGGRGRVSDAGRRRWLLGGGGIGVAALVGWLTRRQSTGSFVRPPGAGSEERFVARCVGCGACVSACPTSGLVPSFSLTRLGAAFTPELVPRVGACLPPCTACGDACFTGALPRLTAEDKLLARIGLAVIDPARCLPWSAGERCVICVDACPAEYAAIELRRFGPGAFRPVVLATRCTGCGLCEFRCPVEGASAIRVAPV